MTTHDTASALREAFDAAFARAPEADDRAFVDLLAIRLADKPYALRLDAVAGLQASRAVSALPGPDRALRGIVGVRGEILPVYDLAALLGLPAAPQPRWFVLVRTKAGAVALAFEQLESFARVPSAALEIGNLVRIAETVRPVVDVASLIAALTRRKES